MIDRRWNDTKQLIEFANKKIKRISRLSPLFNISNQMEYDAEGGLHYILTGSFRYSGFAIHGEMGISFAVC